MPHSFLSYDSTGKSTNGPSPEFEAWRMGRSSPQEHGKTAGCGLNVHLSRTHHDPSLVGRPESYPYTCAKDYRLQIP